MPDTFRSAATSPRSSRPRPAATPASGVAGGAAAVAIIEETFLLVKPDAMAHVGAIRDALREAGLQVQMRTSKGLSREQAELIVSHYRYIRDMFEREYEMALAKGEIDASSGGKAARRASASGRPDEGLAASADVGAQRLRAPVSSGDSASPKTTFYQAVLRAENPSSRHRIAPSIQPFSLRSQNEQSSLYATATRNASELNTADVPPDYIISPKRQHTHRSIIDEIKRILQREADRNSSDRAALGQKGQTATTPRADARSLSGSFKRSSRRGRIGGSTRSMQRGASPTGNAAPASSITGGGRALNYADMPAASSEDCGTEGMRQYQHTCLVKELGPHVGRALVQQHAPQAASSSPAPAINATQEGKPPAPGGDSKANDTGLHSSLVATAAAPFFPFGSDMTALLSALRNASPRGSGFANSRDQNAMATVQTMMRDVIHVPDGAVTVTSPPRVYSTSAGGGAPFRDHILQAHPEWSDAEYAFETAVEYIVSGGSTLCLIISAVRAVERLQNLVGPHELAEECRRNAPESLRALYSAPVVTLAGPAPNRGTHGQDCLRGPDYKHNGFFCAHSFSEAATIIRAVFGVEAVQRTEILRSGGTLGSDGWGSKLDSFELAGARQRLHEPGGPYGSDTAAGAEGGLPMDLPLSRLRAVRPLLECLDLDDDQYMRKLLEYVAEEKPIKEADSAGSDEDEEARRRRRRRRRLRAKHMSSPSNSTISTSDASSSEFDDGSDYSSDEESEETCSLTTNSRESESFLLNSQSQSGLQFKRRRHSGRRKESQDGAQAMTAEEKARQSQYFAAERQRQLGNRSGKKPKVGAANTPLSMASVWRELNQSTAARETPDVGVVGSVTAGAYAVAASNSMNPMVERAAVTRAIVGGRQRPIALGAATPAATGSALAATSPGASRRTSLVTNAGGAPASLPASGGDHVQLQRNVQMREARLRRQQEVVTEIVQLLADERRSLQHLSRQLRVQELELLLRERSLVSVAGAEILHAEMQRAISNEEQVRQMEEVIMHYPVPDQTPAAIDLSHNAEKISVTPFPPGHLSSSSTFRRAPLRFIPPPEPLPMLLDVPLPPGEANKDPGEQPLNRQSTEAVAGEVATDAKGAVAGVPPTLTDSELELLSDHERSQWTLLQQQYQQAEAIDAMLAKQQDHLLVLLQHWQEQPHQPAEEKPGAEVIDNGEGITTVSSLSVLSSRDDNAPGLNPAPQKDSPLSLRGSDRHEAMVTKGSLPAMPPVGGSPGPAANLAKESGNNVDYNKASNASHGVLKPAAFNQLGGSFQLSSHITQGSDHGPKAAGGQAIGWYLAKGLTMGIQNPSLGNLNDSLGLATASQDTYSPGATGPVATEEGMSIRAQSLNMSCFSPLSIALLTGNRGCSMESLMDHAGTSAATETSHPARLPSQSIALLVLQMQQLYQIQREIRNHAGFLRQQQRQFVDVMTRKFTEMLQEGKKDAPPNPAEAGRGRAPTATPDTDGAESIDQSLDAILTQQRALLVTKQEQLVSLLRRFYNTSSTAPFPLLSEGNDGAPNEKPSDNVPEQNRSSASSPPAQKDGEDSKDEDSPGVSPSSTGDGSCGQKSASNATQRAVIFAQTSPQLRQLELQQQRYELMNKYRIDIFDFYGQLLMSDKEHIDRVEFMEKNKIPTRSYLNYMGKGGAAAARGEAPDSNSPANANATDSDTFNPSIDIPLDPPDPRRALASRPASAAPPLTQFNQIYNGNPPASEPKGQYLGPERCNSQEPRPQLLLTPSIPVGDSQPQPLRQGSIASKPSGVATNKLGLLNDFNPNHNLPANITISLCASPFSASYEDPSRQQGTCGNEGLLNHFSAAPTNLAREGTETPAIVHPVGNSSSLLIPRPPGRKTGAANCSGDFSTSVDAIAAETNIVIQCGTESTFLTESNSHSASRLVGAGTFGAELEEDDTSNAKTGKDDPSVPRQGQTQFNLPGEKSAKQASAKGAQDSIALFTISLTSSDLMAVARSQRRARQLYQLLDAYGNGIIDKNSVILLCLNSPPIMSAITANVGCSGVSTSFSKRRHYTQKVGDSGVQSSDTFNILYEYHNKTRLLIAHYSNCIGGGGLGGGAHGADIIQRAMSNTTNVERSTLAKLLEEQQLRGCPTKPPIATVAVGSDAATERAEVVAGPTTLSLFFTQPPPEPPQLMAAAFIKKTFLDSYPGHGITAPQLGIILARLAQL